VIGGAGADLITAGGGQNTVLGDDGEAFFFADGTVRLIQSINLGVGGDDEITLDDGANTVIGGFGADILRMGGGINYVMGDEAKLEVLTNDGVPTGYTILESLNGSVGGVDDIDVGAGRNIVVGGAAGDLIDVDGSASNASAVVLGDNGTILLSNSGVLLELRSIDFEYGAADLINLTSGTNAVIGGAGADLITAGGGQNTVLGDDGEAYFFADGTVRLIQSINLGVGGDDEITLDDGFNTVIGGFGADILQMGGGTNYVMGDEATFAILTEEGIPTGFTLLESINGSVGGIDDIDVGVGRNIVVGGAAGDLIDVDGDAVEASAVVLGDNGTILLSNSGVLLELRSIDFENGAADLINLTSGTNAVIGGAGADLITAGGGQNTVLGDDGEAFFFADGTVRLIQAINLGVGGDDEITLDAGFNTVIGGYGADILQMGGGTNYVMGDEATFEILTEEGIPTGFTLLESINVSVGSIDDIDVGAGRNIVVGGVAGDLIDVDGVAADASAVVLGDNGTVLLSNAGVLLELRSIAFEYGAADTINLTSGTNAVIGGAGADLITAVGGHNTVLGDDGEAFFFADGTVRLIQSINLGVGGEDEITLDDGFNTVIGGFGADILVMDGGTNYVMGDEAKLEVLTSAGTLTGLTVLESINGAVGSIDDIDVGTGRNIVVGGEKGDLIDIDGNTSTSSAVIVGDNGIVILSNAGTLLELRSTDFSNGGDDEISIVSGDNAVIGGRGSDAITVQAGDNILYGDDAEAYFFGDGMIRLLQSINLGGGATDTFDLFNGNNKVSGGYGSDLVSVQSGVLFAMGDEGRLEVTERDSIGATEVKLQTMDTSLGSDDVVSIAGGRIVVFGGAADDRIETTQGSTGQVIALGDGGEAILDSQDRPVRIRTIDDYEGGEDTITLGDQDDIISGGYGDDLINTGEGNNIAIGDTVDLLWDLYGANRVLTFVSVTSEDPLTAGEDMIVGLSGSDVLFGGNGSDTIRGGAGEDVLATHNATLYLPIPQVGSVSGWGMDQLPKILGNDLSVVATEYLVPINASGDLGDGEDEIYGESGNDFILTTPGGHDTIYDLSGYDTLSFQLGAQGVVFDLDYLNSRQYVVTPGVASDTSVMLIKEESNGNRSSIENFVGSQYSDVIYANPTIEARTFKGGLNIDQPDGQPGDELRLRTYGNQVVDSGNILSVAGLGVIYHYEFDTIEWIDGTPLLLDDGDREWFDVGSGTRILRPSLLGGDTYYSTATKSDSSNVAGWTFSKLSPGPYQVSLSWPDPDPANIYTPRVTVRDRSGSIESQRQINQKTEPTIGNYLGQKWYDFGSTVEIDKDRFFSLDYNSNNLTYFLADGLRVERVRDNSSEIRVIDITSGGEIASGLTFTEFGDNYYGSDAYRDFRIVNLGTQPLKLNLVGRQESTSETQFRVVDGVVLEGAHRNSLPGGFSSAEIIYSNGDTTGIAPGQSAVLRIRVDTLKPGYHSGDFLLETNDVNEAVFKLPIAARVGSIAQIPRFVDNQSPGFVAVTGTVTNTTQAGTYGGTQSVGRSGRKNAVRWTQADLPTANYRISTTWSAIPLGDAKATYKVTWGNQTRTVVLSQQKTPITNASSFRSDGVEWVDLVSSADISAGDVVRIELSGGVILADAIRIQQVGHVNYPSTPMLEVLDTASGQKLSSRQGVWDFGNLQFGQAAERSLTLRNMGNLPLSMSEQFKLGPGFKIINDSGTQRTLQPGQSTTLIVRCEPTTFGTLLSELEFGSNDAENGLIGLVLKATVIEELITTADDPSKFRMVGVSVPTGTVAPTGSPYSKSIAVGYNDGDSATWTFPNLESGLYKVFATWDSKLVTSGSKDKPPIATVVPYVIQGVDDELPVTTVVNQSLAADDQYSNNRRWEYLSDFRVAGDALSVTVRNVMPGAVIHADAIRIVRVQYPEARVFMDGKSLASKSLINFGKVEEGESATKTLTIFNPSPAPLELKEVLDIPAGFTTDFQPRYLAPGESIDFHLTFTGDKRGWYRGDFLISTGDSLAGVFQVSLLGEVLSNALIVDDSDSRLVIVGNQPSNRNQSTAYLSGSKGLLVAGDRATWTISDLVAGKYRVSMTWGAQTTAINNAKFTTLTSTNTVQTTWDHAKSPSDYTNAFWDNDAWWVDLASEVTVDSNGTLQVSALNPGPNFRELMLDAIRIQRIEEPVTGVPGFQWIESVNEHTPTYVRGDLDEGYRLDFGTQRSPLFLASSGTPDGREYLRVDETTGYTYRRGYGWIGTAPSSLDQGGDGSDLSYLLRDGVWDTQERVLRLDLPVGNYRFTMSLGDAWRWDPILEEPVATGVQGQKITKEIELIHDRGGAVLLSLKPEVGSSYWMLSSLDVQKIDSIVTGTLERVPSGNSMQASARASGVPVGMYTVDLDKGVIGVPDADPSMLGHQVYVNSNGLLDIPYTLSSATGTIDITATHAQGIAQYSATYYNSAPSVNLRLDLNGSTSQTQAGYIALPEKTWYTPARGYGWQNGLDTTYSIDRGAIAPPKESQWADRTWPSAFDQTSLVGTTLTSLLRDGQKHSSTKEFRTDLPDGVYAVTVFVGGPTAMSDMDISVVDQPTQGIANISTLANEFKRVTFNATATGGKLTLSFSSSIARADWAVNSIEIRDPMVPISVSLSGGNLFDAGSETPYNVSTTVAPGTYSITNTIGSVVATDSDQRLSGAQIVVGSNGQLSFQIRSELPGQGEVLLTSLDGGVQYRIPMEFRYSLLRRLDFNHAQSPLNTDGYRSVLPTNLYDSTKSFGWSARAGSVDRTAAATAVVPQRLFQDKHTAAVPLYFMVASEQGKTYDIRLHLGDTVARDLEISVNGGVFQRFTTAAGEYTSPVMRTLSTDQRIEIYFRGAGVKEWSINGIEVLEVTTSQTVHALQSADDLIAGTISSIQRNQTLAGQVLVPGTYWVSSDFGLITNQAGLRLNQITIGSNRWIDFMIRSSIPGEGTVRLDSADGTVRYEIPVGFQLNPVRLYDFDHVNRNIFSPSANGYTRVLPTTVYSQSVGFGWNNAVKSVDRGASARNLPAPVDLYRDNHFNSVPGTFYTMSEAGKSYAVTVHFGTTEARSVEVSLNGGVTFERVNTAANSYTSRTWTIVASSDRIGLMFRKASGSNWSVNAIEVREQVQSASLANRTSKAVAWPPESLVGIQEATLPPLAMSDLAATVTNNPLRLNVLSNDLSYFGSLNSDSIQIVAQPTNGTVSILEDGTLEYQPDSDFTGQVSFAYRVRDELGITSNYGEVLVNVTDRVHQNFLSPLDVDADSRITPIDVLLVIDRLNAQGSGPLVSSGNSRNEWFDVNGNQSIDPLDVLSIIDYLNQSTFGTSSSGEGEGESGVDFAMSMAFEPMGYELLLPVEPKERPSLESTEVRDPEFVTALEGHDEDSIKRRFEAYLGSDPESLSDEEIADRLSYFIEFGMDDDDEDFWG
jgi:Ca2+-binding RTX toxin-like protein